MKDALSVAPPFDILINNAGGNRPKHFSDVNGQDYDAVMGLNVRAAFFVAQSVAAGMIGTHRRGSLIHISSQMGHVGARLRTLYCASKWAIEGLSKAMALDLAPHGIRSNTIAPTFVETEMTASFFKDLTFKADVLTKIPLGRLGKVEDLMGAVAFLASDAAGLTTGASLVVDGGWTAE
jgi:NAD(P)-dependent dehydrogenase (short-subunit alcohol dehydrogenase family)